MSIMQKLKIIVGKGVVRTVGKTSKGMSIASSMGLTSGTMLDYIYRNRSEGRFLIGRWIDRLYLSNRGWEEIRIRKLNLEEFLRTAISIQRELGHRPVILDVASGPARYVLDVLSCEGMDDVAAICRDLDEAGLELGRRNADEHGTKSIRFVCGDALKRESLAEVTPKPNIAVSSGFYDVLTDDGMVQESMVLLYELLPDGGCFLFTNQAHHVDIETVQALFPDFRGEPLKMVLRPAGQVNRWAENAGFRILQTTGDTTVHYPVTLAQKLISR